MATTYRSDSSSNTTLTLDFTEKSRSGNNVVYTVSWSVKLGSSTSLGSSHNRILYIYKSDGTLCGQSTIKNGVAWSAGSTYSGSFDVTVNVGGTAAGTVSLYGITNSTSVTSCVWTNRSYCTNISVPFTASFTITIDGKSVNTVVFNGNTVTHLIINGTTIF